MNVQEYPFTMKVDKATHSPRHFTIETPWLDEGELETRTEFERIFSERNPFVEVTKVHYDNGFKIITLETPVYVIYRTNWQLDTLENGNFLPRIQ